MRQNIGHGSCLPSACQNDGFKLFRPHPVHTGMGRASLRFEKRLNLSIKPWTIDIFSSFFFRTEVWSRWYGVHYWQFMSLHGCTIQISLYFKQILCLLTWMNEVRFPQKVGIVVPPPPSSYFHEATGLGFVCFVIINARVLSAHRVDFGFVLYFSLIFQFYSPRKLELNWGCSGRFWSLTKASWWLKTKTWPRLVGAGGGRYGVLGWRIYW